MADRRMNDVMQHLRSVTGESWAELTDGELLRTFVQNRDGAALEALVNRHGSMVWGVCRRLLGSQADAEDAFQATFLVLVKKAAAIRDQEAVANWLYGVARQTAVRVRSSLARLHRREQQVADLPETTARETPRDDEGLALLDRELSRLPDGYRLLVVLCDLEGRTRREVARQLGCPEGTVAGRLSRARALLAKRMARHPLALPGVVAAVPASVASCCVTIAAAVASGKAAAGTVSVRVADLVEGVLQTMVVKQLRGGAMLTLLCAALLTGGFLAWGMPGDRGKNAAATSKGPDDAVANPAAQQARPRVDSYGDPLPDGAVRRFGTMRLRNCSGVVYSPDGKYLVTGGGADGKQVVFWDRQTGQAARRLSTDAAVRSLHLTPDGKVLAVMTATVFSNPVWDVTSGKVLFRFKGADGTLTRDGGNLLGVYNGKDNRPTVGCWKVSTGRQVGEWSLPANARSVRCSPDGNTAAYFLGDSLVLYDLAGGAETRRWPGEKMRELMFSPDGRRLAAASMYGLRLWKVADGRLEYSWGQLVDGGPCFSADGKLLAWTGYDRRSISHPWVVEIGRGEPRRLGLPITNLSSQLAFSPDAATLALHSDARALEVRHVGTGKDALPLDANTGRIFGLQLSPDGRFLATFDTYRVLVWNPSTGKLLRRFPDEGGPGPKQPPMVWDVRLLPDGRLSRRNANNTYGHWEEAGPTALARLQKLRLEDGKGPAFTAFAGTIQDVLESPGGRYVAVQMTPQPPGVIDPRAKAVLRVWDTQTRRQLEQVRPPDGHHLGAFSPDRRLLATTTANGTIHLWDLASGEQRLRLRGHDGCRVRALLFTPDNRSLVSGGDDSQVLWWDLTGRAPDGVWRAARHDARAQLALWEALAGRDAAAAHRALWGLAADPAGTVAFLRGRVKPVALPDDRQTRKISALIAQLDSPSFAEREQAQALLKKIGEPAVPALARALAQKPRSLEQALRLERLLKVLAPSVPPRDALRCLRAVEILERVATPAARRLLRDLAGGQPGARLTQAAKESLELLDAPY